MSQLDLENLAQQGDPDAIASLLNQTFEPKGITAKAAIKNNGLHVIVEAIDTPDKQDSVVIIRQLVTRLQFNATY